MSINIVSPQNLKITLLTTSFPLSADSVSGIFVARLVEQLTHVGRIVVITPSCTNCPKKVVREGYEIRVFRYAPRRLEILAHGPGGIPVALRTKSWSYLLVMPFLFAMGISLFRHARLSHIIHANWGICGCVAGIVGKLLRCPVVTTLRGEDFTRSQISFLDRFIMTQALRLSSAVVTVSEAMHQSLANYYPQWADKIHTIPNGVDDRFLSIGNQRQWTQKKRPLQLITIGSLIPRKGIDQIIQALILLLPETEVSLWIIGEGQEREHLESLTRENGLTNHVLFQGTVAPFAIAELLAKADVFVLASHSEGRPNVILEALAAGMPIIGTDIEGINELVSNGKTGLLFKDGDIHEFANHIRFFVNHPNKCAEYGSNAHRFIIEQGLFWRTTGERYLALYHSLLARQA
jgi:glycosyltransferase involved in cell wall biosynthesis